MRHTKTVNIIIVNYNCWDYTVACLQTLLGSTYQDFKIFIVDNNSIDNSIKDIENWCSIHSITASKFNDSQDQILNAITTDKSLVKIIQSKTNHGFAAGNNIVLDHLVSRAKDEYVWLLNPDTEVEPTVLEDLYNLANDRSKTLIGNVIYYYDNPEKIMYYGGFKVKNWIHGVIDIKTQKNSNQLSAIAGASLFTHINTYKDLGTLPEDYFMYWEETDFCTKALNNGYKFLINDASKVFDHVGVTSKTNFLREYLYLLNGLRYYKKYKANMLVFVLISTILKLIKSFFLEDKLKTKAVFYAHIDFAKILANKPVNIKERLKNNAA